jgi:hypothetical protein
LPYNDLPLFLPGRREEAVTVYELWSHPRSGDTYAFRLEDGRVTGCRGPLTMREMAEGDPAGYRYDDLPEPIRRVADSPEPFARAADWLFEQSVTPRAVRGESVLHRALERVAARRRARRRG